MQKAIELSICGNVTYVTGNSIRVIAEGQEDKVTAFLEWCKTSTLTYRINDFSITPKMVFGYNDFSIISRKNA